MIYEDNFITLELKFHRDKIHKITQVLERYIDILKYIKF